MKMQCSHIDPDDASLHEGKAPYQVFMPIPSLILAADPSTVHSVEGKRM
jgi:hypothetical protein